MNGGEANNRRIPKLEKINEERKRERKLANEGCPSYITERESSVGGQNRMILFESCRSSSSSSHRNLGHVRLNAEIRQRKEQLYSFSRPSSISIVSKISLTGRIRFVFARARCTNTARDAEKGPCVVVSASSPRACTHVRDSPAEIERERKILR